MKDIGKVLKVIVIAILLFAFFHPIATLIFLVSNLGVLMGIGIVYALIRISLGMSLISFISKSLDDKDKK